MNSISTALESTTSMLWQCLKHIPCGFYIDIEPEWPYERSVSRVFYDSGWRGISIEPNHQRWLQIKKLRPHDENLCVMVGMHGNNVTTSTGTEASFNSDFIENVPRHPASGKKHPDQGSVITLSDLWLEHGLGDKSIHFLKVNADGAETVLTRNDWKNNRPWVVLVTPMSMSTWPTPCGTWESIMIKADYRPVRGYGMYHVYVAGEQASVLNSFFTLSWPDIYKPDPGRRQGERRHALLFQRKTNMLIKELHSYWLSSEEYNHKLQKMQQSYSWRLTAPLRWIHHQLKQTGFFLVETTGRLARAGIHLLNKPISHMIGAILNYPELSFQINRWVLKWPGVHRQLVDLAAEHGKLLDTFHTADENRRSMHLDLSDLSPRAGRIYADIRAAMFNRGVTDTAYTETDYGYQGGNSQNAAGKKRQPLKILLDLQCCQSGSRFGGIGRYSMALAKAMIREGTGNEFYILLNRWLPAENEVRNQFCGLLPQHRILSFDIPSGIAEIHGNVARTRAAELILQLLIADINPDIVCICSLFEGMDLDVVASIGDIFPADRTAVILHDLIPLVDRERYLTNSLAEKHYSRKIGQLTKAGMLLAISNHSRSEVINICGFPGEKVVNISSAADDLFKARFVPDDRKEALMRKYDIQNLFVMYTSSFDLRKNHELLIKAFGQLPVGLRSLHQLVLIGSGSQRAQDRLRSIGRDCGLSRRELIMPGHIPDDDLVDLYNLCALFVFPSLSEGFGLPALEAMSCGIPTIGSNTTSIPEVIGLPEAMFDPEDVQSMADKIEKALTDEDFRSRLLENAHEQSKRFSWKATARRALKFIEASAGCIAAFGEVADGGADGFRNNPSAFARFTTLLSSVPGIRDLSESFLISSAMAVAHNECVAGQMLSRPTPPFYLGWVTPWHPRCRVASYSYRLSGHTGCLSKIFTPEGQTWPEAGTGLDIDGCWTPGSKDLSSLDMAIDASGVDVVIIQICSDLFDVAALTRLITLQKQKGRIVIGILHSLDDTKMSSGIHQDLPISSALKACHLVLVHDIIDMGLLGRAGISGNAAFYPYGVLPRPRMPLSGKAERRSFTVGTYSDFLPHEGLKRIITAVAQLRLQGIDINLKMIKTGCACIDTSEQFLHCRDLIKSQGLEAFVQIIEGDISDPDAIRILSQVDMILFAHKESGVSPRGLVHAAIVSGALVAATPLSVFSDVREAVMTLPGGRVEDLKNGILSAMAMIRDESAELSLLRERGLCWVDSHQYGELAHYFCSLLACIHERTLFERARPAFPPVRLNPELSGLKRETGIEIDEQ